MARELLGTLGDALVRSELVADTIELLPRADGFVLCATCTVSDELTLIRTLRELIRSGAYRVVQDGDRAVRRRPCSLAS